MKSKTNCRFCGSVINMGSKCGCAGEKDHLRKTGTKTEVVRQEYPTLIFITKALKVIAWLGATLGIIIIIIEIYVTDTFDIPKIFGMLILAIGGGSLWVLACYAQAELIKVVIDIENNTRRIGK